MRLGGKEFGDEEEGSQGFPKGASSGGVSGVFGEEVWISVKL